MTRPTIAETYAAKRAVLVKYVPFGVLMPEDQIGLIKATARDAGVTVAEVEIWLSTEMARIKAAATKAQRLWDLMTPQTRNAALKLASGFAAMGSENG